MDPSDEARYPTPADVRALASKADAADPVVFVHPDMAVDLLRRTEAGQDLECVVRDGQLVRMCGVRVIVDRSFLFRVTELPSPPLAQLAKVPPRGAQWKRERGLGRFR